MTISILGVNIKLISHCMDQISWQALWVNLLFVALVVGVVYLKFKIDEYATILKYREQNWKNVVYTIPFIEESYFRLVPFSLLNIVVNAATLFAMAHYGEALSKIVTDIVSSLPLFLALASIIMLILTARQFGHLHGDAMYHSYDMGLFGQNRLFLHTGRIHDKITLIATIKGFLFGSFYALWLSHVSYKMFILFNNGVLSSEVGYELIIQSWIGLVACYLFSSWRHSRHNKRAIIHQFQSKNEIVPGTPKDILGPGTDIYQLKRERHSEELRKKQASKEKEKEWLRSQLRAINLTRTSGKSKLSEPVIAYVVDCICPALLYQNKFSKDQLDALGDILKEVADSHSGSTIKWEHLEKLWEGLLGKDVYPLAEIIDKIGVTDKHDFTKLMQVIFQSLIRSRGGKAV